MAIVQEYLDNEYRELADRESKLRAEIESLTIRMEQFKKKINDFIESSENNTEKFFFASASHLEDMEFAKKELEALKSEHLKLGEKIDDLVKELKVVEDKKNNIKEILTEYNKEYDSILNSDAVNNNIKIATEEIDSCIEKADFAKKIIAQDSRRASSELDKVLRSLKKVNDDLIKMTIIESLEDRTKKGE